ncbi:XAC2610-related protein [Emticicia sp. BO119]|uniref:XAC2610-related protein n=1 Tax=Emticicia sp. BO119 TaxID=2757768 RepID=UPI0015F0DF6C|nr:hypothetical protein [Emticicia sp. BO119]
MRAQLYLPHTRKEAIDIVNKNLSKEIFENYNPDQYIKIGSFISKSKRHALICYLDKKLNYHLELFEIVKNKLVQKYHIPDFDGNTLYFSIDFQDWNYDGYKDILIRISASNGYTISHYQLFLYIPQKNSLLLKKQFVKLPNPKRVPTKKIVISEIYIQCTKDFTINVCKRRYRWSKNNLYFIDEKCPCKDFWTKAR